MDNKQWLMKLATIKNTTTNNFTSSPILRATGATTNFTSDAVDPDSDLEDEGISSLSLLTLIVLYGVVVFSGIIGNVTLLITLCSQSSSRLRNPLLLALCLADLLVTGVSAPLTIVALIFKQTSHSSWSLLNASCKAFHYMQSISIAASTLCFLMLSFHRYATVKHPRLAQLSQRQFLPSLLASGAWLSAAAICVPVLLAYNVTISSNSSLSSTFSKPTESSSPSSSNLLPVPTKLSPTTSTAATMPSLVSGYHNISGYTQRMCIADYGSEELHILYVVAYTLFVFVVPTTGVILNHLGVRKKLCALSLTARAAHGELPLPMPTILRRPTHMIIVTGMANNTINVNNESSDEEYANLRINRKPCNSGSTSGMTTANKTMSGRRFSGLRGASSNGSASSRSNPPRHIRNGAGGTRDERVNLMAETRFRASPRTPRSIRRAQNEQLKKKVEQPAPELPLPQTSTLRSRRRLANILVAAGVIFAACWAPHFWCMFSRELGFGNGCTSSASDFFLLLGFAHSAVSPILHWALNYNSLRQSTCAPFARLSSAHRFLRSHLRFTTPQPPPSSTNEAALGPFNPRYIKARPQNIYRPPASSHYLY